MKEGMHGVIGIDLGTTYSVVAAFDTKQDSAVALQDSQEGGQRITPSVVSVHRQQGGALLGWPGKRNIPNDADNTVIEIKREMGQMFSPETLAEAQARAQRLLPPEKAGQVFMELAPEKPYVAPVLIRGEVQFFLPQEISALTLMKMRQIAEVALQVNSAAGEAICDAVITVPAYFTADQKKATEQAARLAGLYPRMVIPEPEAAAICYGVDQSKEGRNVYLIYDLGGGTFDVSIISVEGDDIETIATSGNARLGGGDFDDRLTEWAIEQLRTEYQLDVSADPRAKAIIKAEAEEAKKRLSSATEATMIFEAIRPGHPPSLTVTRDQFESLIADRLYETLACVTDAVQEAARHEITADDITAILLVGGSSRIPRVKTMLLEHFGKSESFVKNDLDPDLVVARGAAMMAYRHQPTPPPFDIHKNPDDLASNPDCDLPEPARITEHTLGVGVQNNQVDPLIPRGERIPCTYGKTYVNPPMAERLWVTVFQGEGRYAYDCHLIDKFEIGPMQPLPEGQHQFVVSFSLDHNGILSVVVNHTNENRQYNAKFSADSLVKTEDLEDRWQRLVDMFRLGSGLREGAAPGAVGMTSRTVPPPQGPVPGSVQVQVTSTGPTGAPPPGVPAGVGPASPDAPRGMAPSPPRMPSGAVPPPVGVVPPEPPRPPQWTPSPPPAVPLGAAPSAPTGAPPVPPQGAAAAARPVDASPAGSRADLLELTVEAEDEHAKLLRRVRNVLAQRPDPRLIADYNALVSALNTGQSPEDLDDAYEDLRDTYNLCRHADR